MQKILESLHPLERKVLPELRNNSTLEEIKSATKLSEIEVMRAIQWLQDKNILKIKSESKSIIKPLKNTFLYLKEDLPEKRFLKTIEKKSKSLKEIQKIASLNKEEIGASIGLLKRNKLIEIKKDIYKITEQGIKFLKSNDYEEFLKGIKEQILSITDLSKKEEEILNIFKNRKDFLTITPIKSIDTSLTSLGHELLSKDLKFMDMIEQLTPSIITKKIWENKEFRRYDVKTIVPTIYPGRRHFVNESVKKTRKIWLEMGFKEMTGPILQSSFWNFDALFVPQDHPAREMQDTYYIKKHNLKAPKHVIYSVKKEHEKGWKYKWDINLAKKYVLRTHTTALSAQTLSKLKESDLPAKFFATGKCFRNETLSWKHLNEFNQTEGIVIDENANFRHLIGYLKEFAKKMGFDKVRFRPSYFPFTEPSIEGDVWYPEKKQWVEVFAAGIFRPEVVKPLLGKEIPVLAWGPGLDRMIMNFHNLKDMRELYKNDINQLRKIKWQI